MIIKNHLKNFSIKKTLMVALSQLKAFFLNFPLQTIRIFGPEIVVHSY